MGGVGKIYAMVYKSMVVLSHAIHKLAIERANLFHVGRAPYENNYPI